MMTGEIWAAPSAGIGDGVASSTWLKYHSSQILYFQTSSSVTSVGISELILGGSVASSGDFDLNDEGRGVCSSLMSMG